MPRIDPIKRIFPLFLLTSLAYHMTNTSPSTILKSDILIDYRSNLARQN